MSPIRDEHGVSGKIGGVLDKKKIEQSGISLVRVRDQEESDETGYKRTTNAKPLGI